LTILRRWCGDRKNACSRLVANIPNNDFFKLSDRIVNNIDLEDQVPKLPENITDFKSQYESVWSAFEKLAEECHESGPMEEKTRRLVKVALAVGAGLEGATHSAVRHARESGASKEELNQVAILAITTLGFPSAMRALSWLDDHAGS
jgi:alkylhydroperoxidase/carboxymuconolactone decarboxylase family protein YurZ